MDADLEEYENAMLEEECEMIYAGPEGVEPHAPSAWIDPLGASAHGQGGKMMIACRIYSMMIQ